MAFEQLLDWASNENRPAWQQDSLRRLAENGELTEDDLSALCVQIEVEEGLYKEELPESIPLAENHLSEASSDSPKTVLGSLGPVKYVDRLEPNQPPIRFAINGITLIYGPNGSGKSGYCRIAKQLCRSLSPGTLRGNVYDDAPQQPAEVNVSFRDGEGNEAVTELTWRGNDLPPPAMSRISVFDTASARVYVDKERKIEFLPYELDLLNKLALAARALDRGFKERGDILNASINTPLPDGYTEGTAPHRLVAKLLPATSIEDLPSEVELRELAAWSEEDQAEFDKLVEQSRKDPETLKRLHKEARQALLLLKDDVTGIDSKLNDLAIDALAQSQQDAKTKSDAAEASAHDLFKDEPIPDVGSEVWRQLLKYAKEFASEVFPDREPPQIATADQCVLCQQDLDDSAAARLAEFDSYLTEKAAEEALAAKEAFDETAASIRATVTKSKSDVAIMLAGYAALTQERLEGAESIGVFFEKAGERLQKVQQILNDGAYDDLGSIESLVASPAELIDEEVTALDAEIEGLESVEGDDETTRQIAQEYAELHVRRKLGEEIETIVDRRNKLEECCRVAACRVQCRLTAITQQITRRRREILTPSLKNALEDERKALLLTHIPLNLADRGELGNSIVEVALSAQHRIANNSEVLSEGEQRGLALACFLAELNEIGRDHGIIVDDPVSSIDHSRMQAVARRVAEEAEKGRQVIVFTHNILFHYMLNTEARRSGVACHEEWMTRLGDDRFGILDDSKKPWQMKAVTERMQEIDQAKQALEASGYDHNNESFRDSVTDLYTKLRTTWERVVEEVLFNKVIQRFRPEVMTQSLRAACFDTENDYPIIYEGMKRTSHYSGHDLADDLPPELPIVDDIDQDIDALREFTTYARARKKQLDSASRSYEAGVETIFL